MPWVKRNAKKRPVYRFPQGKREAKKKRLVHEWPTKKKPVHYLLRWIHRQGWVPVPWNRLRDWSTNRLEQREWLRGIDWSIKCLKWSESLRRRDLFTNRLEGSKRLRRKKVQPLPRARREAKKNRLFHLLARAKRMSRRRDRVTNFLERSGRLRKR